MKRISLILALLAVAVPGAGAATTPTLRIVTRTPTLVVTGTHFRAAERVTVKAVEVSRVVRVTRTGTFRADLGAIDADRCSSLRIVAVGARGDKATLMFARAMCAPASSP